ncbi:MAG TPA: OmpA family protein [Cytophagaceae bacterium]|jgi:outer membrane protein OmpA-like peptidoglycan-associated protein|nr:OmpA family protein [Cytophagaceae bacterium]
MKNVAFLSLFFLFFIVFNASSQNKLQDSKKVHLAKEYFRIEDYTNAQIYYEELVKEHPENEHFNYYLGVCFYKLGNTDKALDYFKKASAGDSKTGDYEFEYYLARSFHMGHHFEEAITHYMLYKQKVEADAKVKKYPHTLTELDAEIGRCRIGIELMKKPLEVQIENLGPVVNTEFNEYMPVISLDESEMLFTSRRSNTMGGGKDTEDDLWYEDVYMTGRTGDGWSVPKSLASPVNTNNHDATVCVSSDGKRLFIYKSEINRIVDTKDGNIYFSDLKDTSWTTPVLVNYHEGINSPYWEPSASLSADGNVFVFSSNRPLAGQTEKNRNLYFIRKDTAGKWSAPQLFSDKINSIYEEDGPYLHPDGKTMYFSSNGLRSIGGFDIFKTVYNDSSQTWSDPENIGFPYNTADDDIYIVFSADGTRAYFSSVRENSYGGKDIYMATSIKEKHSLALMIGHVYDSDTQKPLAAEIIVTDNETDQVVAVYKSESFSGKFSIALPSGKNYGIEIDLEGYLFHSENIELPNLAKFTEYRKDVYLHPFRAGEKEILKNVFFDTDKSDLRKESKTELDRLYKKIAKRKNIVVQISGHTDNRAGHEYNHVLSEARSVSVVQYLIDKGFDSKRIFARGYGEVQPIDTHNTEEALQMNRRTEYMILNLDDSTQEVYAQLKDTFLVHPGTDYYNRLLDDFKSVYLKQQADKAPEVGAYLFYKVHFAFGQTKSITDYSKARLEELVGYLEHFPACKVELVSHADYLGSIEDNTKIAAERENLVTQYLLSKGIAADRLKHLSTADQVKVLEEDNKDNGQNTRKLEFKVVSIK